MDFAFTTPLTCILPFLIEEEGSAKVGDVSCLQEKFNEIAFSLSLMWLEYTVVASFIDTSRKTDCEKATAVGGCMPCLSDVLCTRSPLHVAERDQRVREMVR